jgi:hypothetical protein
VAVLAHTTVVVAMVALVAAAAGKVLEAQELLGKGLLAVILMGLQAHTLLAVVVAQGRLVAQ